MLALDHQQRPVAPVPPRYPVAPAPLPASPYNQLGSARFATSSRPCQGS
jgi:hypothetical protein